MSVSTTNSRVVILGANGFLGSALAGFLSRKKIDLVRVARSKAGQGDFCGDLQDQDFLDRVFLGADTVVHFAQATNPATHFDDLNAEIASSLPPLINIADACVRNGVRRLVYPSSGGTIYGGGGVSSEKDPLKPSSPYSLVKVMAEDVLDFYSRKYELETLVLRIGNPYGPGQVAKPGQGVVAHWIEAIKRGKPIKVFGSDQIGKDFIFIEDLCALIAMLMQSPTKERRVVNVGSGRLTRLSEIVKVLQDILGVRIDVDMLEARDSDIQSTYLDISALIDEVGEYSFTPLELGLKETLSASGLYEK